MPSPLDDTASFPDWLHALLENPENHDSEYGRSCHFCGSSHGRYDAPLEHYIDCPWVAASRAVASDLTDALPSGHTIYEPQPHEPCETCGWYYNSADDWRGRPDEMPPPCSDEVQLAHDTHIAAEHGITVEEFYAGPHGTFGLSAFDGPLAWHQRWMMEEWTKWVLAGVERGSISFVKPPDLSDEAIRSPDA